jgi:hypothetical protein
MLTKGLIQETEEVLQLIKDELGESNQCLKCNYQPISFSILGPFVFLTNAHIPPQN